MVIAIELSNLSEIVNVQIRQVKIPITLISVHDVEHLEYHIIFGNYIYLFLKISKLIYLIHWDCNCPICTLTTFNLGLFQLFKLRRILTGQYLARVLAFQNYMLIPLSCIQVYTQHNAPQTFQNDMLIPLSCIQVYTRHNGPQTADNVTRTATSPMPVAIRSRLHPTHALYQATEQNHNAISPHSTAAQSQSVIPLSTIPLSNNDKHLTINNVWVT